MEAPLFFKLLKHWIKQRWTLKTRRVSVSEWSRISVKHNARISNCSPLQSNSPPFLFWLFFLVVALVGQSFYGDCVRSTLRIGPRPKEAAVQVGCLPRRIALQSSFVFACHDEDRADHRRRRSDYRPSGSRRGNLRRRTRDPKSLLCLPLPIYIYIQIIHRRKANKNGRKRKPARCFSRLLP